VLAVVLASDANRDRVYFGTDTRVEALLIGSAASALLVRDWPSLNRGWCLIRSRWGRRVARALPVIGLAGLAAATHYATGSAGEFRHGLLIAVAVAAVLVVAPVTLEQRGAIARILALPHWSGWAPSLTASICGTGQSFWRSAANTPGCPGSRCSRLGAEPRWQWRPHHGG